MTRSGRLILIGSTRPFHHSAANCAELLVVGLAPGLRGANRTGRPFTGDYAGDLLYRTWSKFGFAAGDYGADAGGRAAPCAAPRITNAVRCVPPQNKPEPGRSRPAAAFSRARLRGMPRLRAILALGAIAHNAVLAAKDLRRAPSLRARRACTVTGRLLLADSYHCSRLNTNTGKLTAPDVRSGDRLPPGRPSRRLDPYQFD